MRPTRSGSGAVAAWGELIAGLAAGVLAVAGIAYLLFGPVYSSSYEQAATATAPGSAVPPPAAVASTVTTSSLLDEGVEFVVGAWLSVVGLLALTIAVSAYLHVRRGSIRAQNLLLGASLSLLFLSPLGALSLGLLTLPSALLGLTAMLLSRFAGVSTPAAEPSFDG